MGHFTRLSGLLLVCSMAIVGPVEGQERAPARTANRTRSSASATPQSTQPGPSASTAGGRSSRSTSDGSRIGSAPRERGTSNSRSDVVQPQVITAPPSRRQPPGFPLTAEQQKRVDQILNYWEQKTSEIKTHECLFQRRNYNYVFGSQEVPTTIDRGLIRYSSPDKGLMRVDEVYDVNPQAAEDAKDRYKKQSVEFGEYWVCDGQSVYSFDSRTKTLTEAKLPPDMQGKAIADGPLPFLFGAKAKTMKDRYWIREITPENNPTGEYFLEAVPKKQEDAANFKAIHVILGVTGDQLLPKAMKVLNGQQGRIEYDFAQHKTNDKGHRLADFLGGFASPKAPRGWKTVVEDWSAPAETEAADNPAAARPQAARQSPLKKRR